MFGSLLKKFALLGVGVILLGVVAACAEEAVSRSDYEAVKQQLNEAQEKVTALQKQLAEFQTTTVLRARPVPTPTPAPPAPAAGPRPAMPASYREPVGPFYVYVETLTAGGVSKYGLQYDRGCAPNGTFKRGTEMVWRFEIIDLATGRRLTDEDQPTVKVVLPHGEELTARFSQRGGGRVPDAPWMWSAAWDIPPDYPLGALDYAISITTKDGRSMVWKPPALVGPNIDSRVTIID
jgi:hypothetical protein